MKRLAVFLCLISIFCGFALAENPSVTVTANIPDGSGEDRPDESITVNGITLVFAVKGAVKDDAAPTSWGTNGVDNWTDFVDGKATVYADLTGNQDTYTYMETDYVAYDDFYICVKATGNNLSAQKNVSVSFSSKGLKNGDETIGLSMPASAKEAETGITAAGSGNTLTITHPAGNLTDSDFFAGYSHVTWTKDASYPAGDYTGTITISIQPANA